MAGFLGWLLATSMLQTGGIAWAWGIHFLQDVVILVILIAGAHGCAALAGRGPSSRVPTVAPRPQSGVGNDRPR